MFQCSAVLCNPLSIPKQLFCVNKPIVSYESILFSMIPSILTPKKMYMV